MISLGSGRCPNKMFLLAAVCLLHFTQCVGYAADNESTIKRWGQLVDSFEGLASIEPPKEMARTAHLLPQTAGVTNVFLGMGEEQFRKLRPSARPDVDYRSVPVKGANLLPASFAEDRGEENGVQCRLRYKIFKGRVVGVVAIFVPVSNAMRREVVKQYLKLLGSPSTTVVLLPADAEKRAGTGLFWRNDSAQVLVKRGGDNRTPYLSVYVRADGVESIGTAVHMKTASTREDQAAVHADFPELKESLESKVSDPIK